MNAEMLLQHFNRISEAPDAVARLRRFILDLAVRGKLVAQDSNDEPAAELLKRIQIEKARLMRKGKLKKTAAEPLGLSYQAPFSLPYSWAWGSLGDVSQYGLPNKVSSNKELSANTWVLDLEDIEKDTSRLVERVSSTARHFRSTKTVFKCGDVLFGKLRPYLNKVLVADEDGVCSTEIVAIRGYCGIAPDYVKLVLKSPMTMMRVDQLMYGMKMPRLGTGDAVALSFPLPPLAEQHRIVAKVDELMKLCAQLEAAQNEREAQRDRLVAASLHRIGNATTIAAEAATEAQSAATLPEAARFHLAHLPRFTTRPEHIKQLRQTIRNLAVRGRLVPQDANDEPAMELLKRIQAEKAKLEKEGRLKKDKQPWDGLRKEPPYGLPRTWTWIRLQDAFEISRGGSPRPAGDPRYFRGSIPWITVREITKDDGKFLTKTETGLTELGATKSRFIDPGDLLLTNSGATLGVPKISRIRGCMNDGVAVLRRFHTINLNDYTYLYLQSQTELFRQVNQGMGQPNLNTPIIAGWFAPLPPLAEQHRIVAKVDELMALCDQLETQLTTTQADSRRLLEAVLRDALLPAMEEASA